MNYIIEERDIIKPNVPSEWREQVSHFYTKLKVDDDKKRDLVASIFARYVSAQSRELSTEIFSNFIIDINELIINLINGSTNSEKLGGLSAIEALAQEEYTESSSQINRMVSCLHNLFTHHDNIVVKKATRVLGNLAKNNTSILNNFLEEELIYALKLLDDLLVSSNSFTALKILNQLARNASSLFYLHMAHFLDSIWNGLLDKNTSISFAAAKVLCSALCVLVPRDINNIQLHKQWYEDLYNRSTTALEKSASSNIIRGSLLVLCEMLKTAKVFMESKFTEVCEIALKYWSNMNKPIRCVLINLIGILAEFNPKEFSEKYLSKFMNFLLYNLKNENFASEILNTIGIISRATDNEIKPYLKEILKFIVQTSSLKIRRTEFADKLLFCVSCLSHVIKTDFALYTGFLMDFIFSLPFIPTFVDCLSSLISEIPSLTLQVQIRLMNLISLILIKKPFVFLTKNAAYSKITSQTSLPMQNLGTDQSNLLISLSLKTLNTFSFPKVFLIYFLQEIAAKYLKNSILTIRLEAVITCCELTSKLIDPEGDVSENITNFLTPLLSYLLNRVNFKNFNSLSYLNLNTLESSVFAWISKPEFCHKFDEPYHIDKSASKPQGTSASCNGILLCKIFNSVLSCLLEVAVVDLDPNIRYAVLLHMEPKFDIFLAQSKLLKFLFITVNDEYSQIRSESIKILCRLDHLNPACINPVLRKRFLQLLSEVDYYNGGVSKEINSSQFNQFITGSVQLAQQYSTRIIKALIVRAYDTDSRVSAQALEGLSKLAQVTNLCNYLKTLLPLIIECMQDQSSQNRRRASLYTLGTLIQTTGYVIDPLLKYPFLLDLLISMFNTEPSDMRHTVIRVLGILGALDPEIQKKFTLKVQKKKSISTNANVPKSVSGLNLSISTFGNINEEYYAKCAITALLSIMKNPSLFMHHQNAVQAVMSIFKSLGMNSVSYLDSVVPTLLQLLAGGEIKFKNFLFQNFALLVSVVKQHIREYLNEIFALIQEFWTSYELIYNIATLIEQVVLILNDEFRVYLPTVIRLLLSVYNSENIEVLRNTIRLSQTLKIIGTLLDEYQHLLLPKIISLIEIKYYHVDYELVLTSIKCIGWLSLKLSLDEMSSQIIHSLLRVMKFSLEIKSPFDSAASSSDTEQASNELSRSQEIAHQAVHTICLLMCQLKNKYMIFEPLVSQYMKSLNFMPAKYKMLFEALDLDEAVRDERFELFIQKVSMKKLSWPHLSPESSFTAQKLNLSEKTLRKVLNILQMSTKEDWAEWIRRFSIEILRYSPSISLRSCLCVSDYLPLVRALFNPAFLSCWKDLSFKAKKELVEALQTALLSDSIPKEILQILLDLTEFMEHGSQSFPIDARILYNLAIKCCAYAKALRYKEIEYKNQPDDIEVIESLIILNTKLSFSCEATGILRTFKNKFVEFPVSFYEKLGYWEDALEFYSTRMLTNQKYIVGRIKCLNILGEWDAVLDECWTYFNFDTEPISIQQRVSMSDEEIETRSRLASIASSAAWYLQDWEKMSKFVSCIKSASPVDKTLFEAVLSINNEDFETAKSLIHKSREAIETDLKALFAESYQRAYKKLVRVQQLSELDEVIEYKQCNSEKQSLLRFIWNKRISSCQKNLEVWRRLLAVRAIVVSPRHDLSQWLSYADLARKAGRLRLARNILNSLPGLYFDSEEEKTGCDGGQEDIHYFFAQSLLKDRSIEDLKKHSFVNKAFEIECPLSKDINLDLVAWRAKHGLNIKQEFQEFSSVETQSFKEKSLISVIDQSVGFSTDINRIFFLQIKQKWSEGKRDYAQQLLKIFSNMIDAHDYDLLAAVSYKMARWIQQSNETFSQKLSNEIITGYMNATKYNPNWYKAFHSWALVNYEIVKKKLKYTLHSKSQLQLPANIVNDYLLPAISGFFYSISLNTKHNLQDVLRLLNLWFDYGTDFRVQSSLLEGCTALPVDVWLPVIPQIMARFFSLQASIQNTLNTLFERISRERPQAMVYAITMASKSQNPKWSKLARKMIFKMREHSSVLIDEAELVVQELINVAVLSHENWHNAIEEASRLYFVKNDFESMISLLAPLHENLNESPQTQRQISFKQNFGKELQKAHKLCQKYLISREAKDINLAWDIYYNVFVRIGRLPNIVKLDLESVSPKLFNLQDLELAVPGTYKAEKPIICIKKFYPTLRVIASKQRPRRLMIVGSDGVANHFLLKGHEDLRQDERVMQFFGLVNFLLRKNTRTQFALGPQTDLSIQKYSVIPLNTNTGLLKWVPHCDTLHQLIIEYRGQYGIQSNAENHFLSQLTEKYDDLTYMQKAEIFSLVLDTFTGEDLKMILWLKSPNSEIWLQKRSNFTISLAVMSMVGYILGLGDRHPSNIMLDKYTGKIIHIDFGDCFEVAVQREKYPEKVPFRLTQMLVKTLDVSGVEGTFKIICENVMKVLRGNSDSLMAVLEAFVYDPLINWRLLKPAQFHQTSNRQVNGSAGDELCITRNNFMLKAVNSLSQYDSHRKYSSTLESNYSNKEINEKALNVVNRVMDKLNGRDFDKMKKLDVGEQVDKLIKIATNRENLSRAFLGWVGYW